MNICIIRNSDYKINANMKRVADAVSSIEGNHLILNRLRNVGQFKDYSQTHKFALGQAYFTEYTLELPDGTSKFKKLRAMRSYSNSTYKFLMANKDRIDVVHAFDLDSGLPASKFAKKAGKKFVYHIADFYADSRMGLSGALYNFVKQSEFKVINAADCTIIANEKRREQIEGSTPKLLEVIHNTPVFAGDIEITSSYPKEPIKITYVGGLEERRFIKDMITLLADMPAFELHLAGTGNLYSYVEDAAKKCSNIIFHGTIDYSEALSLYAKTDVMFALYDPSVKNHQYSAPNKVYEAMYLQKPIIVARDSGMDEMVEEFNLGYVVDYSQAGVKSALEDILANPDAFYKKRENLKNTYPAYSWDEMKARLLNIYRSL